jgi:hypothetical protein
VALGDTIAVAVAVRFLALIGADRDRPVDVPVGLHRPIALHTRPRQRSGTLAYQRTNHHTQQTARKEQR